MPPKLKTYTVQGWARETPASNIRIPLSRPEDIQAQDGRAAAATYARLHNVRKEWWDDGSPSPLIVIRVG